MKLLRDWRIWAGLFFALLMTLYFFHMVQRFSFDYAEFGRTTLAGKGYNREDLHVLSTTVNSSPIIGDEATVVFQVGKEKKARTVTVVSRRSFFGPPIVESIK